MDSSECACITPNAKQNFFIDFRDGSIRVSCEDGMHTMFMRTHMDTSLFVLKSLELIYLLCTFAATAASKSYLPYFIYFLRMN